MTTIKKIHAPETYPVRHAVLRKGKPVESCFFDGDHEISTTHLGLFYHEKLTGIISVFKNKNSTFSAENQFQIRGMAILEEFQTNGFGSQLLEAAELEIRKQKPALIWFNARESAVGFYEKSGYKTQGEGFAIPEIGVHFLMYKTV